MNEENVMQEETRVEPKKVRNYAKVKPIHVISMIITLVIAVFVVIQLLHLTKYTLGKDIDINKLWLYEWVLNLEK